jgi:AAA+ superfamily predicted ATPase
MSDETEGKSAVRFIQSLDTLHRAAVSVVVVRAAEPFRVISALRDFADHLTKQSEEAKKRGNNRLPAMPFKAWNNVRGFQTFKSRSNDIDTMDEVTDAFQALKNIGDEKSDGGVYAMMYPHFTLTQDGKVRHPGMVQLLKEYVQNFPSKGKRLYLIVPIDYTLPQELVDDIVIVDFTTPTEAERITTYSHIISQMDESKRPRFSKEDVKQIVDICSGMTQGEVGSAISRALSENRLLLPNVPLDKFIGVLASIKTEAVRRSEVLELMESTNMDQVGGLAGLKGWIRKRKYCFTEEAKADGVDTPKGIALIGPPGTGKSLAAKAISSVLRIPLLRFDVSRVFNSLVGSSEARVRSALAMVDAMSPCVLMIDEVDKVFQSNGFNGDSGVSQRILGAVLTWMQDTKAPVFVVVTANRIDNLPSEFLRKGRLDEVFSVGLPQPEERLEVIKIHLKKRGKDIDTIPNLEVAVSRSEGYVPAELEAAVKEAILEHYSSKAEAKAAQDAGQDVPEVIGLTGDLIAEQLGNMRPLSESFKEQFDRMSEWASNNARDASGIKKNYNNPSAMVQGEVNRSGIHLD